MSVLVSLLFAVLAAGHLALCVSGVRRWRAENGALFPVPAMLCGALAYDNAVIAAGAAFGPGPLLEGLSFPRFVLHAVLTPWLIVWSRTAVERAGIDHARSTPVRALTWLLTAAMIVMGVRHDVLHLALEPQWWAGGLRYTNTAVGFGPLPAIVSGLAVFAAGVLLAVRRRYRTLALAALVMLVVSGAAPRLLIAGNAAELVLAAGLLAAAHKLTAATQDRTAPLPNPGGVSAGRG